MKRVMWLLIVSDILILSAFGLIAPIFAIFIKEGIAGGSVVAAGLSSTIFFVVKSVSQLPFSIYIDTRRKKLGFLILGTCLIALTPFIYAFASHVNYIYFAQVVYGLGAALAYPTWYTLFITNTDKKHRGFEWAIWSTSIGLGSALAAYGGAKIANILGFKSLFFIVGGLSVLGMIILFFIGKHTLRKVEQEVAHFPLFLFRSKHHGHGRLR